MLTDALSEAETEFDSNCDVLTDALSDAETEFDSNCDALTEALVEALSRRLSEILSERDADASSD